MTARDLGAIAVLTMTMTVGWGAAALDAQAPAARAGGEAAASYATPKTPWGEPDLQGTYSNRTITPFERPASVKGREFFTPEEVAALEQNASERSGDEERSVGTRADVEHAYNDFWWDRGTKVTSLRTSLVIDPPDGQVPDLTAEARARQAEERNRPVYRSPSVGGRGTDSWLDRGLFERCITRGMPGAMSPSAYNNNYRITQAPGVVAIEIEMLGGTRVIPTTGGGPRLDPSIRQIMGHSIGRWEGDTLVVETTHFTDKVLYRGAAENLHLVERFTRVAEDRIDYRVTVSDPTTFTRPFTLAIPFVDIGEGIFEYACHEGNYGMEGILSGAREEERLAAEAEAAKQSSR